MTIFPCEPPGCFRGRGVESRSERGSPGGALRAVGVVQLDRHGRRVGEGLAEDAAQEHVGVPGAYDLRERAEGRHHVHPVGERKRDPLLDRAHQVGVGVDREARAVDLRADLPVAEHPLGTVAEGKDDESFRPGRDRGGARVQLLVRSPLFSQRAAGPAVGDPAAVDAQKDPDPRPSRAVVDVGERVDAGLRVGGERAADGVDDPRRSRGRRHLSRLEDIE